MTEVKAEKKSYIIVAPDDLTEEELKKFYKTSVDTGIAEGSDFHISNSKILSGYFEEKKYPFSFLSGGSPSSGKTTEIVYTRILGKLRRCTCPDEYPLITITKDGFKDYILDRGETAKKEFLTKFIMDFATIYDSEEGSKSLYKDLISIGAFIGGAGFIRYVSG